MRSLSIIFLYLAIASCRHTYNQGKVLGTTNLPTQSFTISARADTIIKGISGTILKINANTFVDSAGHPVQGAIEIQLKEALTQVDILMSGLTTTTDGKTLETGGMIYVNATQGGKQLRIADGDIIGVAIPSANVRKGMSVFKGVEDSNGINWAVPRPILNSRLQMTDSVEGCCPTADTGVLIPEFDGRERIGTETDETDGGIDSESASAVDFQIPANDVIFVTEMKGQMNGFAVDANAAYIFSIKQLGWANIDVLRYDTRTKPVTFLTKVPANEKYSSVYITLIVGNSYLPGYRKEDGTYGFTHGDYEKPMLPIGAGASVLCTAYKGNEVYYAISKLTITDSMNISLDMQPTTKALLVDILKGKL